MARHGSPRYLPWIQTPLAHRLERSGSEASAPPPWPSLDRRRGRPSHLPVQKVEEIDVVTEPYLLAPVHQLNLCNMLTLQR